MLKYALAVPIKFIGVFDTVGALGVPFPVFRRMAGSAYPFLNTGLRNSNENAFHAIAIDEHRRAFLPTLWTNQGAPEAASRPIERTEQRWFVGAHANVGGGCFDDPLAQLPLKWLEQKATTIGLTFKDDFVAEPDAALAPISDSFAKFLWGGYRLLSLGIRYYRPIGLPPVSEGPGIKNINETIDSSVFDRWRADQKYRPHNLRAWADIKRIDPAMVQNTVLADNPGFAVGD